MANNIVGEKKKALIARKEKLLEDIQYYEKRIADFHANKSATSFFEDNCSSDSDTDFPIINNGPSVAQLKLQQSQLKTSLQATQELTNLHLLESEVNVMVTDPVIVDEPQVSEHGVWKEVIAECRLDLVPFSITFNVHTPSRKFGAPSYRNLKVILGKPTHETELVKSVLPHTKTPSDAVELLRSYSVAHRSRRTTLGRLAEKYPNLLFMEPMAEGGYILKCADLLEVRWTLQNKWSQIAPFHHRMKFDIEYMDESYIKTITQYHRQLSDPSLETDERTNLLSKIINTCLEAKGPTQELYESMESDDPETAQTLRKRRTTLDQEVTEIAHKKKKDDAIMAPPKSLPKKSKAKGKENVEKDSNEVDRQSYASFKDGISSKSNRKESVRSNIEEDKIDSVLGTDSKHSNDVNKNGTNVNEREVVSAKSKDSSKENKITKEVDGKRDSGKTTKEADVRKKDGKITKSSDGRKESVAKTSKENNARKETLKSTKENLTENSKVRKVGVQKSATDKNNKKDSVKPSKENPTDGTKGNQVIEKDNVSSNLKENNVKSTKVNKDGNSKDNASSKVTKKSTAEKNIEVKKNSAKLAKNSTVPKPKVDANKEKNQKDKQMDTEKGEIARNDNENQNSDKGSTIKCKVNANANKKTDANKINNNTQKIVPKKVKNTDDVANVPAKKAKIDQTAENAPTNMKTTGKLKQTVNNVNKADKNPQKVSNVQTSDKNVAKTTDNAQKKDTTHTKSSETVEKVTEKNKIAKTKTHLVDIAKNNVKNLPKNLNNIQNAKKPIDNIQNKGKSVKSNIENNKNVNNGRFQKASNGNTKFSVKKLSAGSTVKETSAESKNSKIPQKLTKVASSLMKNPLRISPRKLSLNAKSAQSVKKTIQKPITSIPRLLKKPVVKT